MRKALRFFGYGVGLAAACLLAACETSSHKSVRTYEYGDDGRPVRGHDAEDDEPSSEYKMVSPGEMVAPGEPVVDPDR